MTCTDARRVRRAAIWLLTALFALLAADVAAAAKAPALKLSKLSGAPATVAPGGAFTVSVTVKNTGKRKAKAQTVTRLAGQAQARRQPQGQGARGAQVGDGPRQGHRAEDRGGGHLQADGVRRQGVHHRRDRHGQGRRRHRPRQPRPRVHRAPPRTSRRVPRRCRSDPTPTRRRRRAPRAGPTPTPDPVVAATPRMRRRRWTPAPRPRSMTRRKFLYSGANPIQRDVEPGAIERQAGRGAQGPRAGPRRQADRRRPRHRARPPRAGRDQHARRRRVRHRRQRRRRHALSSSSPASCRSSARSSPSWQDYETLDDVVMVPVDPNVKTIDPDSTAPFQVVRGTRVRGQGRRAPGHAAVPEGRRRLDGAAERPREAAGRAEGPRHRVHLRRPGRRGDAGLAARQLRLHVRRRVQRRRGARRPARPRSTSTSR